MHVFDDLAALPDNVCWARGNITGAMMNGVRVTGKKNGRFKLRYRVFRRSFLTVATKFPPSSCFPQSSSQLWELQI